MFKFLCQLKALVITRPPTPSSVNEGELVSKTKCWCGCVVVNTNFRKLVQDFVQKMTSILFNAGGQRALEVTIKTNSFCVI